MKIALLQLCPTGSLMGNLDKGMQACREAARMGADIALFPEMWSNGYAVDRVHNRKFFHGLPAEDMLSAEDEFVTSFGGLAQELNMAICITYLRAHEPLPQNALTVFDRHGQAVLHYQKVHTCDFAHEYALSPGEGFHTAMLDTAQGPVCIGAMICYDREFPESARILMVKGAELILTPNACHLESNRLDQFKVRAYENICAMAMTNYAVPNANGHSVIYDGISFDQGGTRDMCRVMAGEEEGVFMGEVDLERLRQVRAWEIWGDAYRRPGMYATLCQMEKPAEFWRRNNRR